MADEKRHVDEDLGFAVSPRFSQDLGELFTPARDVPTDIDRGVLAAARRHLVRRQPRLRWVRWAVPTAAAAAVIVGAYVFFLTHSPRRAAVTQPSESQVDVGWGLPHRHFAGGLKPTLLADIDRNGRVDILDAFKLARHIESGYADRGAPGWDINGDGLVNREDVDRVAFAAVRLDKGIL
jgi:hypothetical protein